MNGREETTVISGTKKKTRYSNEELEEFRQIINKKLEEAKGDFNFLDEAFNSASSNDIKDTSPTYKWATEEGCQGLLREDIARLVSRQKTYIQCLNNALMRIKNGTYGICLETGELIPKERLRAVPHATLGMNAKLNRVGNVNGNNNIHQPSRH